MMTSAPYPIASRAPSTLPTCAHWRMPASCRRFAQRRSGAVQYQTTKSTFSSIRTSTWASVIDHVRFRVRCSSSCSDAGAQAVLLKNGK